MITATRRANRPPQITSAAALRAKSTAELLAISMGYDRREWAFEALGVIQEILKERSRDLPEFVEAVAEVKAATDLSEATRAKKVAAAAARANRGSRLGTWLRQKLTTLKLSPTLRLSLTIAAGVFLGLLAMRIATAIYRSL